MCSCIDGYYDTGADNSCGPCNTLCPTCFGPTTDECYTCDPLYKLDGNSSCIPKTLDEIKSDEKIACETDVVMIYEWYSRLCVEKCGDGIDMGSYGCDDGNLIPGDGCNEICQVESGYYCMFGTMSAPDKCYPRI